MHRTHALTAALLTVTLAAPLAATTPAGAASPAPEGSQVVLDWERVAFATIYPATPIPSGVPILGFTSMAMYDAARTSLRRGISSETAAVATAAHGVLLHYYPAAQASLDAHLDTSLAGVPEGPAETKGRRIGHAAAAEMLASRVADGYGDRDIHYALPPGIGVWQPTPPATDMLGAWIGSLRPLVLKRVVEVDGPDPISSEEYAVDYNEVMSVGSTTSATRTPEQTETALFYNSNSATMLGDALIRRLEEQPIKLGRTARIFAAMHAAMTDSLIRCWQLKRDVGFWRPAQAITGAELDGNPATSTEAGWTPLVANPPYSDYVSGHACLTGPAAEVIRRTLGENTALELRSANFPTAPRTYATLRDVEHDAFHARIWSGLHFRDAMEDGYFIGHHTAQRVLKALD